MTVRAIPVESPVHPATHGVLAGAVSSVLGVAAHVLGGGHGLSTAHLLVLASLAVVVGVVRAGQVRGVEQRRAGGRITVGWGATAAALVGGQIATHLALTLLGYGATVIPGGRMLAWHAVAIPVAVMTLVIAERVERAVATRVAAIGHLAAGVEPIAVRRLLPVTGYRVTLTPRRHVSCAGIRGPPARV